MNKRLLLVAGVLLVMVILIIKTVDLPQLLKVIQGMTMVDLGVLVALSLAIECLKVLRFYFLLLDRDIEISLLQATRVFISGESMTLIPGGESVRLVLLKKETNTEYEHSTAPILSHGVFDSVVAAVIVSIGALYFTVLQVSALIVDVLLLLLIISFLQPAVFSKLTELMAKMPKVAKHVDFLTRVRHGLVGLLSSRTYRRIPGRTTIFAIVLSALSMGVGGFLFKYIIEIVGGDVSVPIGILLYASSIVIAAVSGFIPGGLGLTEGGITGILYAIVKLSYQQSVTVALLYRALTFGLYVAMGIVMLVAVYGARFKREGYKLIT